jgi:hypothetical protein
MRLVRSAFPYASNAVILALSCAWLSPLTATAGTPVPTYGTYFGGTGDTNVPVAVAVDPQGNVVVAGYTTSQTLPGTANAFQPTKAIGLPDNQNVFIAKFDPTGQTLLWTTFLGGNETDTPVGVAIDGSGNIYVAGNSNSTNFPGSGFTSGCTGGATFQQDCPISTTAPAGFSGTDHGFVAEVTPDGNRLVNSLQFAGYCIAALAVTSSGAVRVAANTSCASNFYLFGNSFLFGVNLAWGSLDFGVLLGGGSATVSSIALDSTEDIYLGGTTPPPLVPGVGGNVLTTPNAFQGQYSNAGLPLPALNNGFVLELNPSGSTLLYGTYFGPEYYSTTITGIALSADGSVYFTGSTNATAFQATPGAYLSTPSSGFIAKLTPGSSTLDSFSYLPSSPLLEIGNQPEVAYVTFNTPNVGPQLAELNLPALALASMTSFQGFGTSAAVLAPPYSIWLAGSCSSGEGCALGNLISSNAFQPTPSSTGSNALIIQLTDIPTSPITIQTNPAGLQFSIDGGAALTAPQTLDLTQRTHTIAVTTPQAGAAGTQYVFSGWSDGTTTVMDSITVGTSPATYTASFTTQYQLTISASPAAGGTVTPASGGFYASGAVVPITATANGGYAFSNWTGSAAGASSASTTVTMGAPQVVTANFTAVSSTSSASITIQFDTVFLIGSLSNTVILSSGQNINLETGAISSSGGDIRFTGTSITPVGSAGFFDAGTGGPATYNELTSALITTYGSVPSLFTTAPITGGSLVVNEVFVVKTNGGNFAKVLITAVAASGNPAFFNGEVSLGSGVEYLQFSNSTVFGYYTFVASTIFYQFDMGFEAFVPGSASDIYLYDFTSSHWWYTSNTLFPYVYDFTLKTWIYYFPNTMSTGHYTTNPRYFSNLTTGQIFTM